MNHDDRDIDQKRDGRDCAKQEVRNIYASTARERTLARALKAALKWPYDKTMINHVIHGIKDKTFDPSYIADVADIRAGANVAAEIGEGVL